MKRLLIAGLALVAALVFGQVRGGEHVALAAGQAIPRAYIVVLKDGADARAESAKAARDHGVAVDQVYEHALKGFAFRGSARAAAALAKNANVEFVSEDRVVEMSARPGGGGTNPPPQPAETVPAGVARIGGPAGATAGAGVRVAVIDTGIDLSHPDLAGAVHGKNCLSSKKKAIDDNGHGTHVAGTIAARDNDIGVVGVAPGAGLVAVKVLNSQGSGTWSAVVCGIDYVTSTRTDGNTGNDIHVANMSLGGGGASDNNCGYTNNDALHRAICRSVEAGVTYVVAAGNAAVDSTASVPAAYPEVITVSALADFNGAPGGGAAATCRADADDTFADFSNYGAPVDIAAPGVCINSTWKGGGYNVISGTSMATPHVAGAAAVYLAANQGASPAAVRAALIAGQEPGPIAGDPDAYAEGVVHLP